MNKKIAIVGAGVMGQAIIKSLLKTGINPNLIVVRDRLSERVEGLRLKYHLSSGNLIGAKTVILAVKPQDLEECINDYIDEFDEDVLIVSLLAGVRSSRIESAIGNKVRVIRVMSNTPLILGEGMSVIARGKSGSDVDENFVSELLSKSGETLVVEEEVMDEVTAVSGSGPAYIYGFVEALINAARRLGLKSEVAELLVRQTLVGATRMIQESGKDVSTLRAEVTSPNGTTAAAMSSFEANGWGEIVFNAMKAARDRAQALHN